VWRPDGAKATFAYRACDLRRLDGYCDITVSSSQRDGSGGAPSLPQPPSIC
jgi:hypothetical protein